MRKINFKCLTCGKEFISKKGCKTRIPKYCSLKCFHISRQGLKQILTPKRLEGWAKTGKRNKGRHFVERIKQICPICGKEFYVLPWQIKKGNAKYCSRECKKIAQTRKRENSKIKKVCQLCGKEFYAFPWEVKEGRAKYCSKKCGRMAIRGKNNSNWRGGISSSSQRQLTERDWDKIRRQIYKRDNYQCQICGARNIRLECHHIIPWRISHDDTPQNLITVCKSCHTKLDSKWRKFKEEIPKIEKI